MDSLKECYHVEGSNESRAQEDVDPWKTITVLAVLGQADQLILAVQRGGTGL